MPKPLLSIGIIFKDDIRCIERCLKALEPLRKAISCELVMADTGSGDGSRQVAERYADILFDFPWINDFAAARNAVMDRCSGRWFLSVDTDEYLARDISEIVRFLRDYKRPEVGCVVCIRNHETYEMDGNFTDFLAMRMVRMSTGLRYEGAIHEHFNAEGALKLYALQKTIFDHDGYVGLNSEQGKAKLERNMALLRKKLEENPDNLMTLLQFIESGVNETDLVDQLRHALALIEEKRENWERIGPPIFRHAVIFAEKAKFPEFLEWLGKAEELFPNSPYTRIDVAHTAFGYYWNNSDYAASIKYGEMYLKAMDDYNAGRTDPVAQMFSVIKMTAPFWVQNVKVFLTEAYRSEGRLKDAVDLIKGLDMQNLDEKQTEMLVRVLKRIHARSQTDTTPMIMSLWEGITSLQSKETLIEQRKRAFIREAGSAFTAEYRTSEDTEEDVLRHAYTLFLPLADKCETGQAAAILDTTDVQAQETLLTKVDDWKRFPIHALAYALECGVRFPLPDMRMTVEEMDRLAGRLSGDQNSLIKLTQRILEQDYSGELQELVWKRGMVIATVRCFDWKAEGQDAEQGMALARAFAQVEGLFVSRCYAPEILCEENIFVLPPLHRFGWFCAQAFEMLAGGNAAGYVHFLRTGLETYEDMKSMVEFLVDNMPKIQTPPPSTELQMLAEQIRTVLANFAPDDPAVAALRQSEAYQKVAWIIEGASVPVAGGLLQ